jgi:hypothetical protein
MAKFVCGAVFGIVVGIVGGAAIGSHAQDPDPDPAPQIAHAADLAGVDKTDLAGALATTGYTNPYAYLRAVNELEHPPQPTPAAAPPPPVVVAVSTALAECIISRESHGNPWAVNPRSGASGLGQFLPSTWLTTPQGRAGLSVFDPVANRAAVNYMLAAGRGREFVTYAGCR